MPPVQPTSSPVAPAFSKTDQLNALTAKSSKAENGLADAAKTVSGIGKAAAFIPGFGAAISMGCGLISGFLSFLAAPSG